MTDVHWVMPKNTSRDNGPEHMLFPAQEALITKDSKEIRPLGNAISVLFVNGKSCPINLIPS